MKNYSRLLQKLLFCVYLPTTSLSVVNTRLHDVAFRVTLTSAGSVTISSPSLISYKNVLSHAFFFQCHDHTFAKIDWSPQTAQTASRGDVSVKPQRKCFTEKAFNHLPFFFFFPGSCHSKPHISMNEGTAVEKNDMLCCLERDVLHGLQYSKWCYYL